MNLQILANIFYLVTFAFFPCRGTSRAQEDKEFKNRVKAVQKKMSNFMDSKESTYESDQQSVATTKFSDHSSWEIDPFCPARASSRTEAPSPVLPTWASQEAIIRKQARKSRKKDIDNDIPTKARPLIEEKKNSSKQQQHSRKGLSSRELRIYEEQQQHEGRKSSSEIVPFDKLSNNPLEKKKSHHRHHDEKRVRHHEEKLARKKSTSKKPPKPNSYWAAIDYHQPNKEDDHGMVKLRESSSLEWSSEKETRAQRSSKHRYDGAETSKREYLRDEHKRQSNNGLTVYEKKRHEKSSTKNRASREHRTRKSSKVHDHYGGYEDYGYDEMARSSSGIINMQKLPRQRSVTTPRTMVLRAQSPRRRSVSRSSTMQEDQRESSGRRRQNVLDKQIVASFPLTIKQREVPNHEELKNFSQELLKRNSPAREKEQTRRVILTAIEEEQEKIKKNPELCGDVRDLSNPSEQEKAINEYFIGVANNCETKIMPEKASNISRFVSQVKPKPRSISKFFNIKSMPPPRSRPNQYDWNGYEEFGNDGYEAEHEAQSSQFLTLTRDNYNNGSALAGDSAVVGLRQNSSPPAVGAVNNAMSPQFDDAHHYNDANYAPSYDSDENSAPGTPKQLEWKDNPFDSDHYASLRD